MTAKQQTASGLAATILFAIAEENLPGGGIPLLVVMAGLAVAAAIWGPRFPLYLRVFVTGATFYLGYVTCLVGRTMEPGFSLHTLSGVFLLFGLYAALPTLTLLRLWRGRLRLAVVASVFPVSLAIASAVAAYEENQFIEQHRDGIGPTARWTVSNHWLAYDAKTQHLWGSD
ncbi:MAG: hypothetical protein ABIZ81_02630 [Opitutaceae bacterium]